MLTGEEHNGRTYDLHGEPLTQEQLASYLSRAFDTDLTYREMTVEEYRQDRVAELGEFLGRIIAGIRLGALDTPSQFREAAGREHQRWEQYFAHLRGDVAGLANR